MGEPSDRLTSRLAAGLLSVVTGLATMVFAELNGSLLARVATQNGAAGSIVAIAAGMVGALAVSRGGPAGHGPLQACLAVRSAWPPASYVPRPCRS